VAKRAADAALRAEGLRRNPSLVFWKNFAQYGMFLNPAWAIFLMSRGLDGREVFLLGVVYAIVTALAEIPTSWVGDHVGRRKGLLLGTATLVASAFLQISAEGFLFMGAVMALRAVGDAFHSGTEEAVIVDSARELGHPDHVVHDTGVGASGHHLAKAIVPVVFAVSSFVLTGDALFTAMAWLTAFAATAAFVPVAAITEPSVRAITTVREALRPFRRHPILVTFMLHGGLRFTSILLFFMAYPALFSDLGIGRGWLGAFYALFHVLMVVHSRYAWKLDLRYGSARLVNGMSLACVPLGLLVAFAGHPVVAFVIALVTFTLADARGIYYVRHANEFIPPPARATTLSLMRMVQRIVEVPFLLAAAWIAERGIGWVFCLFSAMSLFLCLFPFPSDARIAEAKLALKPRP
jgi:MFS family permease